MNFLNGIKKGTVDFNKILLSIREHWYIIAVSIILCTSIIAYYCLYILDVEYSASTKIYISNDTPDDQEAQINDILTAEKLAGVCKEIAKSEKVINAAKRELGNNIQINRSRITVNSPVTSMIQLTVKDKDPQRAADIANAITDVLIVNAKEITKIANITPIDKATIPTAPDTSNIKIYCILAAIVGMVMGIGVIMLIEMFDKTIKGPGDITEQYGLTILGLIPKVVKNETEGSKGRSKGYGRQKA